MKNVSTLLAMMAMAASEAVSTRSETLSREIASCYGPRTVSGSQNPTRQPKARKAYYTVDSPEVKRMRL